MMTRKNSILKSILRPIIIIMIGQAALFYCITTWGGAVQQLNANAFDILDQKVITRRNYIENEMVQRWSYLDEAEKSIIDSVTTLAAQQNMTPNDLVHNTAGISSLLDDVSDDIVYLLKKNSVTGAFLILDNSTKVSDTEVARPSIYIRDLDPRSSPADNSDLAFTRGPTALYRKMNISTDISWSPQMMFPAQSKQGLDYYYKPFDFAVDNPQISSSQMGYWSLPFKLDGAGMEVVTFSRPIILPDGTVCGVLGVDISVSYLKKLLPNQEIIGTPNATYSLVPMKNNTIDFGHAVINGSSLVPYLKTNGVALLEPVEKRSNAFVLHFEAPSKNGMLYSNIQPLKLYNHNTPFASEQWVLVAIVNENNLFSFSRYVEKMVLFSTLFSIAIGIAFAIAISTHITNPIAALVKKLRNSSPSEQMILEAVNIQEIDELSSAITDLSLRVADSSSKMSQIIKLADIPIGAFEYVTGSDTLFCTDGFFAVLGLDVPLQNDGYFTVEEFERNVRSTGLELEEEVFNSRIFKICNLQRGTFWVRLTLVEEDSRSLGVIVDITQDILDKRRIEYERDYDPLTGLFNRRAFNTGMEKLFRHPQRLKISALIMLDLDNLKFVNDTYGHDLGDEYLRCAANALKKVTMHRTLISRMSGDEFFVFIYGYDDRAQIHRIIEEIKLNIRSSSLTMPDSEAFKVRASAGVAWYPDDATDVEKLMRYADYAMYTVKTTTKGEIGEFDIQNYHKNSYLLKASEELNKFIDGERVEYVFQPIVDVRTGHIFSYEALMRSNLKTLTHPGEILALARSQSKQYQIERMTLLFSLRDFISMGFAHLDCKLFINSISSQFLSDTDLDAFIELAKPYFDRLVLEITEDEKYNQELSSKKSRLMLSHGGETALDDFGTGYNGEVALLSLAPNYVKMDMSIVRGIDKDPSRQSIFRNWVRYSHKRGIKVIAEGVETAEEMETVINCGTDYIQGFYLGRPQRTPQVIDEALLNQLKAINDGTTAARSAIYE